MSGEPHAATGSLAAARALAPIISAAADEIDRESRLPPHIVAALQDAGLFKLLVPMSCGGAELPLAEFAAIIEELARADASVAWCVCQNNGVCNVAAYLPHAAEVFGAADFAIAWGQGRSRAIRDEGGYRLTGEWSYASGIGHATWLGCQEVPVTDAIGEPIRDADGQPQRRIFLFPASDAEVEDVWQVSGLRGTGSDTFRVNNLFVPDRLSPGASLLEPGPLYVFNRTNLFSAGFASAALGVARAALDAFEEIARTKAPRGVNGVLREQQSVQIQIGEAEATLRSARSYLHGVIGRAWAEAYSSGAIEMETRVELRLSSTYAFRRAADVVDRVHYLAGTSALAYGGDIERRFRDMHAITQHIQGREDHFEPAGQFFLGLPPGLQWL